MDAAASSTVIERIARARRAVEAALEEVAASERETSQAEPAGALPAGAVARAFERVEGEFAALGDLAALLGGVEPSGRAEAVRALEGLARVHAVLTMSVAREKDALCRRLVLARSALRGLGWHSSAAAGGRCDLRG